MSVDAASTFLCRFCGVLLVPARGASAGENMACPGCGREQRIPTEDQGAQGDRVSAQAPATRSVAAGAASRYPTLAGLSGVYSILAVALGGFGVLGGVVSLMSGGPGGAAPGLMLIALSLVGGVALAGASEGVKWMIDVEDHLRAIRGKP